jgi:hypothetical protein
MSGWVPLEWMYELGWCDWCLYGGWYLDDGVTQGFVDRSSVFIHRE